jgi:hypothetical protein
MIDRVVDVKIALYLRGDEADQYPKMMPSGGSIPGRRRSAPRRRDSYLCGTLPG